MKFYHKVALATAALMSSAYVTMAQTPSETTMRVVDEALEFSAAQAQILYSKIEDDKTLFPRTLDDKGELITNKAAWWTSGFFPGTMWYIYEYTKDQKVRGIAEQMTSRVLGQQFTTDNHDVGFLINCSAGNGYRLTGKQEYRTALINASKSLATRFNEKISCTRSWDNDMWIFPVIIDNMMNMEVFCVASSLSGDNTYYELAKRHSDKTMKCHFRSDYSTYHVVDYDPQTGEFIKGETRQGLRHESAWARGQAWALYGYTMMYRETGKKEYLDQALHVADFIINHRNMPNDMVPYWDFDVKAKAHTSRDASAAAIMASAFIELSTYVDGAKQKQLLRVGEKQVRSLASKSYRSAKLGDNQGFILTRSVGFFLNNSEVDVPLSYADYYFVEAMMRLKRLQEGRPVVDVITAAAK